MMAAADIASFAALSLHAWVMLENPGSPYMWDMPGMQRMAEEGFKDTVFSPCCYGAEWPKPTRLRCYPCVPPSMGRLCRWVPEKGEYSCGHGPGHPHLQLGFAGI